MLGFQQLDSRLIAALLQDFDHKANAFVAKMVTLGTGGDLAGPKLSLPAVFVTLAASPRSWSWE